VEELFPAAELAFTRFPMKTKEMLDRPWARSSTGLASFSLRAFLTIGREGNGIRVRLLHLRLKFRDHSVQPRNTIAKLFLAGEGCGSATRGGTFPSPTSRSGPGVGPSSETAPAREEAEHHCSAVPEETAHGEDAGTTGGSQTCPTTRYGHKIPQTDAGATRPT